MKAWSEVRVAHGLAFEQIVNEATEDHWTCGKGESVDAVARLLRTASQLRSGPFFMPYGKIASALGMSKKAAYEAGQRLHASGIVQIVDKGCPGTQGGTATTWRWVGIHSSVLGESGRSGS